MGYVVFGVRELSSTLKLNAHESATKMAVRWTTVEAKEIRDHLTEPKILCCHPTAEKRLVDGWVWRPFLLLSLQGVEVTRQLHPLNLIFVFLCITEISLHPQFVRKMGFAWRRRPWGDPIAKAPSCLLLLEVVVMVCPFSETKERWGVPLETQGGGICCAGVSVTLPRLQEGGMHLTQLCLAPCTPHSTKRKGGEGERERDTLG